MVQGSGGIAGGVRAMTTVTQAIASLSGMLQTLTGLPANKIVRGQANNVPAPLPPSIVLTPIGLPQYTTTRTTLDGDAGTMGYSMPKILEVQMDFYGITGGDMANIANTAFRSIALEGRFPPGVVTLYCTDARQFPLTTGEKQYEDRWSSTLRLQYNASVILPQESFNKVGEVGVDPANVTTPAE